MSVKRLSILTFVAAVAVLALAGSASAQNSCLLQGTYVFSTAITSPGGGAHIHGTVAFTPPGAPGTQLCLAVTPGTVVVDSEQVKFSGVYIVNGVSLVVPFEGGVTTGFVALLEGNAFAKGFVYTGVANGGVTFSGTALRLQ